MNRSELREWLGITPADGLVYIASAAIVAMYFAQSAWVDGVLGTIALAGTVAACPLGMKSNPALSAFTNRLKRVAYPICVAVAVLFIWVNYAVWNA